MDRQHGVKLKNLISEMSSLIESQKKLINRSLECLATTKASLAVTKVVKRFNEESLSAEEQKLHDAMIVEAYDTVSEQMLALGKMETELKEIENEILFYE